MKNIPTEAQEQTTLFQWAKLMEKKWPELQLLHAIPNGGSRNPIEARHLKEQGVKAGIPDIFLPCPKDVFHGLYIEMKRKKGGRVSEAQREMIMSLKAMGYRVEVCEGWEKAKTVIVEYMSHERTV